MSNSDPWKTAATAILLTLAVEHLPGRLYSLWEDGVVATLKLLAARIYLATPQGRKQLAEGEEKARSQLENTLLSDLDSPVQTLPAAGLSQEQVLVKLRRMADRDQTLSTTGKVSGGVYVKQEELAFLQEVMKRFVVANQLHPEIFPSARQLESEVVRMVVDLFHGDRNACGSLTTGGTESLLLMVLAYREWGRARGIRRPNIVAPVSVHAAVAKAGAYFDVRIKYVDLDPVTLEVDPKAVEQAITCNTVAIIASAPSFPHGTIDPITVLSDLALRKGVNMHVDCCLGGFLLPFMTDAGFPVSDFDFRVKGVTSISCDPHKYGCTPKGVSVIMYRSTELRRYQFFRKLDWPGGLYTTPTMGGSRSGMLAAAAWSVLVSKGRAGYVAQTKAVLTCVQNILRRLSEVPEIQVLGRPKASVIAFTSNIVNIYTLSETLHKQNGWSMNSLQLPAAVHICITPANCHLGNQFIEDLKEGVARTKAMPNQDKSDSAALYGMIATMPDKASLNFICDAYLETMAMSEVGTGSNH